MLFSCIGLTSLAEGIETGAGGSAPAETEGFDASSGAPTDNEGFGGSDGGPAGNGEFTAAQAGALETAVEDYDPRSLVVSYIDANAQQTRLGYVDGVTAILDVDGLKFKDLNKNGVLDAYEDCAWTLKPGLQTCLPN